MSKVQWTRHENRIDITCQRFYYPENMSKNNPYRISKELKPFLATVFLRQLLCRWLFPGSRNDPRILILTTWGGSERFSKIFFNGLVQVRKSI